jgi:hypothetical protein
MVIFFTFGYIHNIHKDGIKWKEGKQEGGVHVHMCNEWKFGCVYVYENF